MVSFEEAGRMLDDAAEALPEEIFKSLNGGVNLLPDARESGDGRWTLGLYHNDIMGRRVEIFYGSFAKLYGDIPAEEFRAHLGSTLHHELTHHIEGLAGDRTLERWDEAQTEQWLSGGAPLEADSLLFVDEDDCALAPAAAALFALEAREDCPEVRCASAGMTAGAAPVPEAVTIAPKGIPASGLPFSSYSSAQMSLSVFACTETTLQQSITEPPPTARMKSTLCSRASFAPSCTFA